MLYKQLARWLDVPSVIMYSCLHGQSPRYHADLCVPVSDVSARQHLRSATRRLLVVPRCRPVALELATRQLEKSGSWQGQLQTLAEDASIFTVLIEAFSVLEMFRTIRSTNLLTYIHGTSVRPSGLFPPVRTTRLAILSRVPG